MKIKLISLCLGLLALAGGIIQAAPLGTAFTYQGRLEQNGQPATGAFLMRFSLWNAATLGAELGSVPTNTIPVTNGLFNASLEFGATNFLGEARWLQVEVWSNGVNFPTLLTPRTRLAPTPNAIYASTAGNVAVGTVVKSFNGLHDDVTLVAGSGLSLTPSGNTLTLASTGPTTSPWAVNGTSVSYSGGNVGLGIATPLAKLQLNHSGQGSVGLFVGNRAPFGSALFETDVAIPANTSHAWFAENGDRVFSVEGGGKGYFKGNVGLGTANPQGALQIVGTWDGGRTAVRIEGQKPSIVFRADPANGNQSWLAHNSGNLQFFTVPGGNVDPSAPWEQVMTMTSEKNVGIGSPLPVQRLEVVGNASQTAILGYSSGSIGVFGRSETAEGVRGESSAQFGGAVVGLNQNTAGGYGVYGESVGAGVGVWGKSASFEGVHGETTSSTFAASTGINLGSGPGVFGESKAGGYGGYFVGKVRVGVLEIAGGADLAEPFPMKEATLEKGSVVVIDEDHPGRLKLSTRAYDTQVAGVVSGANGIHPGIALQQEGALDQGQNVALTGRVYVQADASFGAIKPGDLLTTSNRPGHAMKVTDSIKAQGAILGKAMTDLAQGNGLVLILVTLQ